MDFTKYTIERRDVKISGKINHYIVCPSCGANNDKKFHCSIVMDIKPYIKCFVCGYYHSFVSNETFLGEYKVPKRKADIVWLNEWEIYQQKYITHPDRYSAWQRYKNLSKYIVDKYQLGLGSLPMQKHDRLITPLFNADKFLTFRGRALSPKIEPKWIFAKGGVAPSEFNLLLAENCEANSIILIVENYIDAILFNELRLTIDGIQLKALPTLSTNNWFELWTNDLLALAPLLVVIAYDNDYAGNGLPQDMLANELTQRVARKHAIDPNSIAVNDIVLYEDYYTIYYKHNGQNKIDKMIASSGIRLNNQLVKCGLNTQLLSWQRVSNIGKDLGDLLST